MAINLFIDTNVFLAFYHLTGEDLEELKKLAVLVEEGEINLLLPSQVVEEFERNREAKIADAIKSLREQKLNFQFPQLAKDYQEYKDLRKFQRQYETAHSALLAKVEADVAANKLKADEIISKLFASAERLEVSEEALERARLRMDLGNPPGKRGSLGDAIIWETLLEAAPQWEWLHFVTDDQDYASPLSPAEFSGFLSTEWQRVKHEPLASYRRLSEFFKAEFPTIELAGDMEKDLLIRKLATSPNFATTHSLIARLRQYTDFTDAQANAIVAAVVSNSQVHWIINDSDVKEFVESVIKGREEQLSEADLEFIYYSMAEDEGVETEDED